MIVYFYILESDFSKYYCKKIILFYFYLNYVDIINNVVLLIVDKSIFKKMVMIGLDIF